MPRATSADVPSGNTSQSFTDSDAAGASALTRSIARGCPTSGPDGGSASQISERASSSRWSVDSPHGRCPAQSIQAVVPVSAATGSGRWPSSGTEYGRVGGTGGSRSQ